MSDESVTLAKIAALKKSLQNISPVGRFYTEDSVRHLFHLYTSLTTEIKRINPALYSDLPELRIPQSVGKGATGTVLFEKHHVDVLANNLDFVLELQSNTRIGEKLDVVEKNKKIFISHGRSTEWHKLQAYVEKDMELPTMELAQEPNLGRTILQKLNEESNKCSVAAIVMTGDDIMGEGEIRARENVMHEIGYFQGKYGLSNVILLHESGVNIPSNIHGLVYIPFPKDTIEATYGALARELKVILRT